MPAMHAFCHLVSCSLAASTCDAATGCVRQPQPVGLWEVCSMCIVEDPDGAFVSFLACPLLKAVKCRTFMRSASDISQHACDQAMSLSSSLLWFSSSPREMCWDEAFIVWGVVAMQASPLQCLLRAIGFAAEPLICKSCARHGSDNTAVCTSLQKQCLAVSASALQLLVSACSPRLWQFRADMACRLWRPFWCGATAGTSCRALLTKIPSCRCVTAPPVSVLSVGHLERGMLANDRVSLVK